MLGDIIWSDQPHFTFAYCNNLKTHRFVRNETQPSADTYRYTALSYGEHLAYYTKWTTEDCVSASFYSKTGAHGASYILENRQ